MISFFILLIFLISGFAGLSYEIVWIKQLSLIFGVSSHAVSSVVAAFMGGLALGSFLFGRLADRRINHLWVYAILETGIAVSALLLQVIFPLIDNLYATLSQNFSQFSFIFIVLRFLLCFAALLIPTTLMGGTLPIISKFFITKIQKVGKHIGLLYSFNTVGGVLGCMAAGFLLLRYVGTVYTIWIAASLNLTAALITSIIAFYNKKDDIAASEDEDTLKAGVGKKRQIPDMDHGAVSKRHAFKRLLVVVYAIVGFTSIAYQVLWTRVLVYLLGNDIYAFTTILSTFLVGIALGSYAFSQFTDKNKHSALTFGLLQLGIGLSSAILLSVLGKWIFNGSSLHIHLNFFKSFFIIFIPTFLMGAAFPVIIKLYTSDIDEIGGDVGNIYAANTIGGIAGSLSAGFILLPLLGAQKGIILLACISIFLGIIALVFMPMPASSRKKASILAAVSVIAVIISAINVKPTAVYSKAFYGDSLREILYYNESAEASLTVLRGKYNSRGLNINGETTAYTEFRDLLVHKMLAHIPILLSREPENALIVGFGLGSTAHSFSLHPLKKIDCAELVPKEKETAQFFLPENNNILKNQRFNFIPADGRNYLKTTTTKYDIISMNAIHPKNSPYLYTQEFYQLCKKKLSDKGVMCAWMPSNTPYYASLINTFLSVFPHASLWFCNAGHMVLIGTPDSLQIDYQHWQTVLAREDIKTDLADLLYDDPIRLLSTMVLAEDDLRQFAQGTLVQTDDLPKIEFEFLTDESQVVITSNVGKILNNRSKVYDYLTNIEDERIAAEVKRQFEQYFASMGHAPDGLSLAFTTMDRAFIIDKMDKALAACPNNLPLLYDYVYIWSLWIMADPAFMLSDKSYLPKVDHLRKQLMSHYDAILQTTSRPVIEMAVTPIRLAEGVLKYLQEDFVQAHAIMTRVLTIDPNNALAREILTDSAQKK